MPRITDDRVSDATRSATTSEKTPRPRETDRVMSSTAKVTAATRATMPRALRSPSSPWMGPRRSRAPRIPRNGMGPSMSSPASTSRARDDTSTSRSTSPAARTIWMRSRTTPTYTARNADAAR
ncbi:hypothetical protein BC477_19935 [Clavibacter michiganensis subsp. michiganensis]|uniref:Uncharacterized protein n=1 Tax=Clavibacter michiganensis subsp. michiganensis TaxID=33013 RepID=A0A251XD08_CLAMM|nr:hypothetical protein BC477_19935 [Clavibacter michiganensis subsp. michiganensis]OUD99960.1 hypothetical protein CMMCAS07_19475 [Clavibacter michiganensis subsp. michiganensis]